MDYRLYISNASGFPGHSTIGIGVGGKITWSGYGPTTEASASNLFNYSTGGRVDVSVTDALRYPDNQIPSVDGQNPNNWASSVGHGAISTFSVSLTPQQAASVANALDRFRLQSESRYDVGDQAICTAYVQSGLAALGVDASRFSASPAQFSLQLYTIAETGKFSTVFGSRLIDGGTILRNLSIDTSVGLGNSQHCFPPSALITLADNTQKPINEIAIGDLVATYDSNANQGRGALLSGVVIKLFTNITQVFLRITSLDESGPQIDMSVTEGHGILCPDGVFREAHIMARDFGAMISAHGDVVQIKAERLVYSAETAHLYPEAERLVYASEGGLALAPIIERGWQTLNFEVRDTHVYIADNARVHNESVLDLVDAFYKTGDHASTIVTAFEADGVTPKSAVYTDSNNAIHFLDSTHDGTGHVVLLNEKVVISSNDGTLEHAYVKYNIDRDGTTGTVLAKQTDTNGDGQFDRTDTFRADGTALSTTGTDTSGNVFSETFDTLGNLTGFNFRDIGGRQVYLNGDAIGLNIGSSVGKLLAGGNFTHGIVASTLIGSLGQTRRIFSKSGNRFCARKGDNKNRRGLITSPLMDPATGAQTGMRSVLAELSNGTTTLDAALVDAIDGFGAEARIATNENAGWALAA